LLDIRPPQNAKSDGDVKKEKKMKDWRNKNKEYICPVCRLMKRYGVSYKEAARMYREHDYTDWCFTDEDGNLHRS